MFKKIGHRINVRLRWLSIWLTRVLRFLVHDIWYINTDDLKRWKGNLVKELRLVTLMMSTFIKQKISFQITALAFDSMLAVVPIIAIGFYLADSIGLKEKFATLLIDNLGQSNLVESLISAADNIATIAESGLFGFISMASFIWIVISLMLSVRKVFNNVWRVESEPKLLKMIGVVLGSTLLSPVVIALFFSGSVLYSNVLDWIIPGDFFLSHSLKSVLSWLSFAGITILAITAMYKYIPGTKVRVRYALKAAIYAGILFTAVQFLYLETQVMVSKHNAVFGVFAAIPLFMIWLRLGWSIIIYGAQLSYAFQNVDRHRHSGITD